MTESEHRDLVRRGYDAISRAYRSDAGERHATSAEDLSLYRGWITELAELLPKGARVLDLGCGAGLPATGLLVRAGFDVLGVDFSAVQIARARELVPDATFVEADMTTWDTAAASFDAIASFYALIHVPLPDQRALFARIRRWLRPGGYFLAIVGYGAWTGVEEYLGAPMFWDHADVNTYLTWFREAGLEPIWNRFIPEGESGHALILARAGSPEALASQSSQQ